MSRALAWLKRMPIDLGQGAMAERTEGKRIGLRCVPEHQDGLALDLGARAGTQTRILEEKGYQVISADVTPLFERCLTVDANDTMPFADGTFDVLWCSEVIEHLESPESVLGELRRVTRPGGRIVLTTPNSGMWLFRLLDAIGIPPAKLQHEGHLHFFSAQGIQSLAPDARVMGYFPYAGFKATLSSMGLIGWLSPTFVLCIDVPVGEMG